MGEGKSQSPGVGGGGKVRSQQRARRLGICHHSGSILPAPLRLLQDLAKGGGASMPSIVISSSSSSSSSTSATLQRRNAIIRKNSAPARARIEIAGQAASNNYVSQHGLLLDVSQQQQQQHQRCSLTAVSQGLSIISTSAVVVLYVSDRRPSLSSRNFRRFSQQQQQQQQPQSADCKDIGIARHQRRKMMTRQKNQRVSYPVAARGIRRSFSSCLSQAHHQQRRRWTLGPATFWMQPSGVVLHVVYSIMRAQNTHTES